MHVVPSHLKPQIHVERPEPLRLMDELEAMVLHGGWPVPCSPYYVINHQRLLGLIDRLRESLQDEMDERLLQAFAAEVKQMPPRTAAAF